MSNKLFVYTRRHRNDSSTNYGGRPSVYQTGTSARGVRGHSHRQGGTSVLGKTNILRYLVGSDSCGHTVDYTARYELRGLCDAW